MERIQKIIANCGYCSRRKAEDLISAGKVTVNGAVARIGQSADIKKDTIIVDATLLTGRPALKYLILNKPAGIETTLKSAGGLPTVASLVKSDVRLVPAGRLDVDSRGLVMLSNDGEVVHRIMHPSFPIDKVYEASIKGKIPDELIERLRRGLTLENGERTMPCKVDILRRERGLTVLRIVLHEGKKRQIRRMLHTIGFNISDLVRTNIGNISVEGLSEGTSRELIASEVAALKKLLRMKSKAPKNPGKKKR